MDFKTCGICGKLMNIPVTARFPKFCSRACSRENKRRLYEIEDDGPAMPPLDKNRISDEGFVNLITAIVSQAKDDVMTFAPGTMYREDAEEFFLSDYFHELTNLDGFDILYRLSQKYEEKQRKKESRKK